MNDKGKNLKFEISFKRNDIEMALYHQIVCNCKLDSISGWFKKAAMEKLERDENPQLYNVQSVNQNISYENSQYNPPNDLPFSMQGVSNFLDSFK